MAVTLKKKLKALVTGGAGFIGSQLAGRLIKEGLEVVVIDDLSSGRRDYVPDRAAFHRLDITDNRLTDIFVQERPDYVFHLAAQIDLRFSVQHPIRDAEVNVHGSLRVLDGCVKANVKKIIFSSSGGAIYHGIGLWPTPENVPCMPLSPYGVAKLAFELYLHSACHNYGLKYTALRYANVYGPRQDLKGEAGVIGIFTKKILDGEQPVIFGDGEQTRDFVYVDDIIEANVLAMRSPHTGSFNIGTARETSVNRIVELIAKAAGSDIVTGSAAAIPGEERRSCLDNSAARKALKWRPRVKVEEGIRRTVEWFKSKRLKD